MASTTFSGPIKAGTISNTTGSTLGDNVKNVGQVVMTQSSNVANAGKARVVVTYAQNNNLTAL
jgi:hypothetical protein